MRRRKWFWRALSGAALLTGLAFGGATPSLAVVGPSSPAGEIAGKIVMVLTRGAEGAGYCSGIALSSRVILTAAHCVREPGDIRIYDKAASGGAALVEVARVEAHPLYRPDAPRRRIVSIDLALLQTKAPLSGAFAAPRWREDGDIAIGEELILVGYGVAREGEARTGGVLRRAHLQAQAPLSKILLWAVSSAGSAACGGDSGAPIFAADGETLLAIVAWTQGKAGRHCGALTQGALVRQQRGWIGSTMEAWGEKAPF